MVLNTSNTPRTRTTPESPDDLSSAPQAAPRPETRSQKRKSLAGLFSGLGPKDIVDLLDDELNDELEAAQPAPKKQKTAKAKAARKLKETTAPEAPVDPE